jgi:hypothetical protein
MSFLNDLIRIPPLKDMPPGIKVVKEKAWLAIEKDHRRFCLQYTAAPQTGPCMAHIEGEHATLPIPTHAVAKLVD